MDKLRRDLNMERAPRQEVQNFQRDNPDSPGSSHHGSPLSHTVMPKFSPLSDANCVS